jgi:hypothetical protein
MGSSAAAPGMHSAVKRAVSKKTDRMRRNFIVFFLHAWYNGVQDRKSGAPQRLPQKFPIQL